MFRLIDDVFSTRNDPDQLQVTPAQQKKLTAIHPVTLSERSDANGPYIWVLMIPTTFEVMCDFLECRISETGLLERTEPGQTYDAVYLCSATTLPEYRKKGETKQVCVDAIRAIASLHPLQHLYVWPFTDAGDRLAVSVAHASNLPLLKRNCLKQPDRAV